MFLNIHCIPSVFPFSVSPSKQKRINVPSLESRADLSHLTDITAEVLVVCPQHLLFHWLPTSHVGFQEMG